MLLHKYYDWQFIESFPLSALGGLLSFACKEEERIQKEEIEKRLFPLWLANYAVAKLKNTELEMNYEQFLSSIFSENTPPQSKPTKRTAEEIEADLMRLVKADKEKKKGG